MLEIGFVFLAQTTTVNPELNIALRRLTQLNQIQKWYFNRMKQIWNKDEYYFSVHKQKVDKLHLYNLTQTVKELLWG